MASSSTAAPQLDVLDHCPVWDKGTIFLQQQMMELRAKKVADIGGGANPMIPSEFLREHGIEYTLFDISQAELDKAPAEYHKIQVDMTAPNAKFLEKVGSDRFDLIFSHMFLEHVKQPVLTHRNIHSALRSGGRAIHMYPTANNLPLAMNRLLPEGITRKLVSFAQPQRDLKGTEAKFPAYYAMCGPPNEASRKTFNSLGFNVLQHTGYIGHNYYKRIPVLRNIELALRPVLVSAGIPLTTFAVLVLEKQ